MSFLIASGHVEVEAKTDAALSKLTALVGAIGALGPAAGVAGAAVGAAGVGLAAFGAAAGKQIGDLKKASEAQSKYQDAVEKSGKSSQEAIKAELAYQQTLSKMPRSTREATAAFSALKDTYNDWSDALADDTMPVFTKSFQLFSAILPKTQGLVRGTSGELDRMITLIAGEVASPGFDRFMDDLTEASTGTLRFLIDGVMDLSRSVAGFAQGGGFDGFMDTAQRVGPLAGETLGNLAEAVIRLMAAGGDLGVSMLTVANALAEVFNSVPTGAVSTFLQLYAAWKLLSVGAAALTAVTGSAAAAHLAAFSRAARFGGVGSAITGVAQRMSTLQKVAVGLGVLGIAAIGIGKLAEKARGAPPDVDRLTTSLKNLATTGKFTGELQKTFGDLDGLVAKVRKLDAATAKSKETAFGFRIPGLDDAADKIASAVDDFTKGGESLNALKDDFKSLDAALAGMVSSGSGKAAAEDFNKIKTALRNAGKSTDDINKLFPQYKGAVASLRAEQQLAAAGMGLFGQQAVATKSKLDQQKQSADGLRQAIQALNDVQRGGLGAMNAFEQSIDDAAKAAQENRGSLAMVNGQLDLNSAKARAAESALRALAQNTDAAAAAARESGASWERVNGIYTRGRSSLVQYAQQMGLSKAQAEAFASSVLKIPDKKSTRLEMKREDAIAGLDAVIKKIRATPGSKSVTVKTLSKSAIDALEAVGFKVKRLPDGSLSVTAKTGTALSNIGGVQAARDRLSDKSITITTRRRTISEHVSYEIKTTADAVRRQAESFRRAKGGPVRLAAGGTPVGGRVEGPGTSTSDSIPALLSNGEWVIRAAAVAKYGDEFMHAINTGTFRPAGFKKGGKLTAKQRAALEKKKQREAEERRRQAEGKSALRSDTTFTTGGRLAGYKHTETVHDLGMPDSVSTLVSSINTYLSNIKKAFTGSTERRLVSQLTSSGKTLLANQKKLESVNKSLESAKTKLDDLKGKFDQLKTSVSSSLVSFGNIAKIGKFGTSPETLIKQLQSDTSRTSEFSKMLEQLRARGLNATALGDIAQAGVTGGGLATAQSLLRATPEQIKKINELQKQLQRSSDAAGTTAAKAMYGAGLKAAEGLVKGLTAQQNKIEATMMRIAQSMEKAIKKALGIRSPSKVMEPIGSYAFQGVEQGWAKRMAAGRTLIPSRTRAALPSLPQTGAPAGGGMVIHNLTVHVSGTFDFASPAERRAAARALVKDMNEELRVYQRQRMVSR
ncbi:hypothetical protein SMD44_00917 [Streptomyces alboflavus]|uniref:Phage tail protein n=1 Tax=Streptomyces alboflavus TaxID=67267 RepID=A0A1Z1W568_9ACTN|nr:phage tail protein [Streptomyces alboflavus]ARX81519.1 hypothetical protein SMD44_00917 [Streptomyces alboflavus]